MTIIGSDKETNKNNMKFQVTVLYVFMSVVMILPTYAHHSSSPHFDKDIELTVTGVITELKMVNPHAYLYFEVETDGDMESWRCELSSATQLRRQGWSSEVLPAGELITLTGNPARREDNVCYLNTLTLSNGQVVRRSGSFTDGNTTTAAESADQRPLVLPNGQPNLQGPWVTKSFGRRGYEGERPRYQASAAGELAAEGYDMAFDDPILQCHFVNIINAWNHDMHVNDIYQEGDTITMQYGFMDLVRTIHLNMDDHPNDVMSSDAGHSIGKWEDDVLVVHTSSFTEGVLAHITGLKHSDQMEVIERFHYDSEEQKLYRNYTITDPLYLVGETKGQDVMAFSSEPYSPYGCVELSGKNNIRPTDSRYNETD